MRAFMSDRDARELYCTPAFCMDRPSDQALAEARRILAETEPRTTAVGRGPRNVGYYAVAEQLYIPAGHPFLGEAGLALAESLPALIADLDALISAAKERT